MSVRLTTVETAALLHVTTATMKRWRREGVGPSYLRIGSRIYYEQTDVDEYVASRKVETDG